MALTSPVLVTSERKYIQETIDLYTDDNRRIIILQPQHCAKRVIYMKEKYDDLSNRFLKTHPYINIIINLQKEEYYTMVKGKQRKRQILYPGLPCFKCLEMIPIDSKCVIKKGGKYVKSYHCQCAREINVI